MSVTLADRAGALALALVLSGSTMPAIAVTAAQDAGLAQAARRCLAAPPAERPALAARLRDAGAAGGRALLEAVLAEPPDRTRVTVATLDLLLELCPAAASADVASVSGRLDLAGRSQVLRWMARRDLPGFRDVEQERARALVAFLEDGELSAEAARLCAGWDLGLVADALAGRLVRALRDAPAPARARLRAYAESLASLRSGARQVETILELAEGRAPWLMPSLLGGLAYRLDLVTGGRLDRYVRVRHPAVRQAFLAVVDRVDGELFSRLEHGRRVELFRRFRTIDPQSAEWALREAHAAVMDLGSPAAAAPALDALSVAPLEPERRVEAALLRAIAARLADRDPGPPLERAARTARASWPLEAPLARNDRMLAGGLDDFEIDLLWRRQVPPAVGEDEITLRRRRFQESGGTEGAAWRNAGRRYLALLLTGHVLLRLRGRDADAGRWLDEAAAVYARLDADWNEQRLGDSQDLEVALTLRTGPIELLERALEGNEIVAERIGGARRRDRLAAAERGFRSLVTGLARRLPERVLPLPGQAESRSPPAARERAFVGLAGAMARFYQRIGEEEKAAEILDHLIARLTGNGHPLNERRWADYLFDRASIAMDRRKPDVARARLREYVAYYERQLRDVRLNPDRYYDAEAVRAWFSAKLAQGHISLAVLHNVVLGELDTARDHCRKAYALDDSPFNRVLYACYLARDGRGGEARALLATVDATPPVYYNMACTYALAGEPERALRFLELDLKLNHATRKARNRQRDWAAKDNDLASLRQDPRFQELVRQRPAGEKR